FTVTNTGWRVEHLTLALTAPHPYCGDLAVTVTSPGGIQSRLAELHGPVDNTTNYLAWTFSSVRHWGEKANGAWTVKVADLYPGVTGTLKAVELNLYGTVPAAMLTLDRTNQHLALNLEAAAPGWKYAIDASTNGLAWTELIALTIPTVGRTNYTETNVLEPNQRFYRARLLP